jgi:2-oxoglutarate ferredoxin oxidoreductase subunit delta
MVYIKQDSCKGCGICIALCPVKILEFSKNLNSRGVSYPEVIDQESCTECFNCMIYCPDMAVVVVRDEKRKGA